MIKYHKGDVTNPIGKDLKFLVHCVNDLGVAGAGVIIPIIKKWPHVKTKYQAWIKAQDNPLGKVLFVSVSEDLIIANLCGQKGVGFDDKGIPPIRYDAFKQGFKTISKLALKTQASIHMPRIGCGLAGGSWKKVESLIQEIFNESSVIVYDYGSFGYNP